MAKYYPKVKIAYGKTWVGNESGDAVEKTAALFPATWESGKVPTSTETEGVFEWGDGGGGGTFIVKSVTTNTPPEFPQDGDIYILPSSGEIYTAWSSFITHDMVVFKNGKWQLYEIQTIAEAGT